jgi:hypothetical protein
MSIHQRIQEGISKQIAYNIQPGTLYVGKVEWGEMSKMAEAWGVAQPITYCGLTIIRVDLHTHIGFGANLAKTAGSPCG